MKTPKTKIFLLSLLALVAVFLGYNYFFKPFYIEQTKQVVVTEDEVNKFSTEAANLSAVEIVFNRFSSQDRVGQLMAWPIAIDASKSAVNEHEEVLSDEFLTKLSKKRPGIITLFGSKISTQAAKLAIEEITAQNGSVLPTWIAVDHEGGTVQRLNGDGFTKLASWRNSCSTDKDKAEQVLAKSAQELSSIGVNIVLAPVLDVGLPNGWMGDRLCSNKPEIIVDRVNLYNQVFKAEKILPVIKHFPGIGKVAKDLHNEFAVTRVGVEDVFVYRSVLNKDSSLGVMTAHIGLENQYAQIPCTLSPDCVGELITNYPKVLVFADALEMRSASYLPSASQSAKKKELSLEEVSYKAVMAGNDVLMFGPSVSFEQMSGVYDMLNRSYLSDPIFREKVDQSVKKIIGYKLGLTTNETEVPISQPE